MGEWTSNSVMVTGGCGFIGSHLVRRLLAEGARRVVVLDSLRHGSEANLAGLADPERVARVRHTLGSDDPALRPLEPPLERLIRSVPAPTA